MKHIQSILFIILTTLVLQSCVADKPANKKKSSTTSATTSTPTTPTFTGDEALYWFTTAKVTGTITVNQNTESIMYLRGSSVHSFLLSTDPETNLAYYQNQKSFCLVANYGAAFNQLRLRAVPISISNYTTKSIERLFRIDVPSKAENSSTCGTASIDGIAAGSAAYALSEICPECLGTTQLTSASLKLFQSNLKNSTITQIPTTKISLSSIGLKVDLQSNSTSPGSSCANSSCEAKGFDCCVEGQCVKDASVKSSAKNDMSIYNQAMSEYAVNPLSFLNWPNIFNICTNITHNPPPTVDPNAPTPLSEAEKRVKTYLQDYKCIEQYESSAGVLFSECSPNYITVKKKLAMNCGCPDIAQMDIKCPNWGVRPLYKSSVETIPNIIDFYCYAPVPENPIGPITNLNVTVSSRSAPHRFFNTLGENKDSLTGATLKQEGVEFYYLDLTNRASPVNGSFNINSILGSMNANLSQTQPSKMVAVELGKTYILSATNGYFTPCSTCAKDSWFQSFTAHPATTGGMGLRSSGYTTSRDTYSANTTLGNYEDTHFGRACYLPVTMIPFSHKKEATLQVQRANRLKTQSAFYINGYQKDWFGFNKGALIGSFDGVSWFAIGSGRRVTATTTKLFLAINGSFLDLADRTDTVVNIIPDISASVAADFDFDPTLTITDAKQNTAGSCQQFHQCSTDTDCVTQLGWEYTCADVSQYRSRWPLYDSAGNESVTQEKVGTIFEILAGTTTQGDSAKRCVYRGAGAPCIRDFTTLNGKYNQKNLTCAPNFYCAALTTSRFNDELVRSPNELDNIFFGMDTNVLGRPLKYVTAVKPLLAEIIANIKNNGASDALGLSSAQVEDMGICRPGKSLSATESIAHSNPDTAKRTDYINQIASCDSTAIGSARTTSCPAFGADLDYLPYNSTDPLPSSAKRLQNFCGGEAKHTTTLISAFANIEGGSLNILRNITTPIFAADACLRRAGSVCHTDLDCGPNKMHEDAAGSMALAYFGGTEAEQNYWKESLICGQGTPTPTLGAANYKDYKLSENRCCREIGKDFTMFTSGPSSIVPENMGTNVTLNTKLFSYLNPTAANRYSRYTTSPTALASASTVPTVNTNTTPLANQWKVINETGSLTCCGGGWVRKFADGTHDWKIKNRLSMETSNFSCLNFRSPLASSDFSGFGDAIDKSQVVQSTYQREYEYFCKSPGQNGCMQILFRDIAGYSILPPVYYEPNAATNIEADDNFSTITGGVYSSAYTPLPPYGYSRMDTIPVGDLESGSYTFKMNADVPYQPFPYYFTQSPPYDLYIFPDGSKRPLPFFIDKTLDPGLHIYLPAYIPYYKGTRSAVPASTSPCVTNWGIADLTQPCAPTIKNIYVKYVYEDEHVEVVNITGLQETGTVMVAGVPRKKCDLIAEHSGAGQPIDEIRDAGDMHRERWCISSNTLTGNRPVLNVRAYTGAGRDWKIASVIVDFMPIERANNVDVSIPGNPYYYLAKLSKLELIGIPQITYEPLYCNSDQNKLVPGIFTSTIKTRSDFESNANSFTNSYDTILEADEEGTSLTDTANGIGNKLRRVTYQDKLAHSAIFSAKDFACCTPLGKTTASAAKCCSGTAATANGVTTCKLPTGTDLNVYYNKFVSSEGVGENEPGGGLVVTGTDLEIDFNQYTGEPKMRTSTYLKLEELGKAHCLNGIVGNGGSFGQFPPEPYSGYSTTTGSTLVFPMSIVDSIIDSEAGSTNVGKFPFDNGYRWDNHYYCK